MTINQTLKSISNELRKTSESSLLDAEVLLSCVLEKSKEYLYTHPEEKLSLQQLRRLQHLRRRRLNDKPIAYIINRKEFLGLEFYVDKRVLIPRPKTENLVENVIEHVNIRRDTKFCVPTIVDIGTGCGAIAVSLAKNIPGVKIYATDISKGALEVAKINAKKHSVEEQITFFQGNLLKPITPYLNHLGLMSSVLITANLPYLSEKVYFNLPAQIKKHEPKIALYGGKDGLDHYRELYKQIRDYKIKNAKLFLEVYPEQMDKIKKIAGKYLSEIKTKLI